MGLDAASFNGVEDSIDVEWGDSIVHVWFEPNAHTPMMEKKWLAAAAVADAEQTGTTAQWARMIPDIVTRWDILGDVKFSEDEDGVVNPESGIIVSAESMFPLVESKLRYLPTKLTSKVFFAVMDASRPKVEE